MKWSTSPNLLSKVRHLMKSNNNWISSRYPQFAARNSESIPPTVAATMMMAMEEAIIVLNDDDVNDEKKEQ